MIWYIIFLSNSNGRLFFLALLLYCRSVRRAQNPRNRERISIPLQEVTKERVFSTEEVNALFPSVSYGEWDTRRIAERSSGSSGRDDSKNRTDASATPSKEAPTSSSAEQASSEQQQCSICLEILKNDDFIRTLPCHHCYHQRCIDKWLTSQRAHCPVCKYDYTTLLPATQPSISEETTVTVQYSHKFLLIGVHG